jgi:Tol biopolymer transport system component
VACLADGIVVITTETRGVDPDPDGYDLVWQDEIVQVSDSAPLRLELRPGLYQTMLRGVAGNCSVPDSYWQAVQLEENAEVTLSFRVDCWPRPVRTPGDFAAVGQPAYGAVDSDSDLYLMALDGSWEERLTNHPGDEYAPAISPTGDRVAFLRQTTHGAQVVIIDLITRLEKLVPIETTQAVNWSPDGTRLVIIRNGRLTIADLRDGSIRSLDVLSAHAAYWSPDGTRLAFTAGDPSGNSRVTVINVDGSNQQALTTEGRREAGPWSPDGKRLLLRVIGPERYCDWECYDAVTLNVLELASGEEKFLGYQWWSPQWTPNGDRIFVLNGSEVWSMKPDGGEFAPVPGLPRDIRSYGIGRLR